MPGAASVAAGGTKLFDAERGHRDIWASQGPDGIGRLVRPRTRDAQHFAAPRAGIEKRSGGPHGRAAVCGTATARRWPANSARHPRQRIFSQIYPKPARLPIYADEWERQLLTVAPESVP
jgi:hypothetical protein